MNLSGFEKSGAVAYRRLVTCVPDKVCFSFTAAGV